MSTEPAQPDILAPLVLDLVEWVSRAPRPYAEVLEAWRTSCPRLTVWEDAVDCGLVERLVAPGGDLVAATQAGRAALAAAGRGCPGGGVPR